MSYGVVSWQEVFGAGASVEWERVTGGAGSSALSAGGLRWGFRDNFAQSAPGEIADEVDSVVPDIDPVVAGWVDLGGNLRWSLQAVSQTDPWDVFRLVFPDLDTARQYGFNATLVPATLTGDTATIISTFSPAGLWNGGCNRFVEDEPDTLHRVEVSQSPYTIGANTHVRLGHRDRRTGRWVQVHGAYIHRLLAEDSRFTDVANRNPNNPNNLLDRLVRVASEGAELYYTPQGRPEVRVQIVDADPRVSQYASRVGQSGRRYDVQIGMEVIA